MADDLQTDFPRRAWLADLWRVGFIALLALAGRSWIICHTEVISRDGINFIRYAQALETPPEKPGEQRPMTRAEVLKTSFQPPGYSVTIVAVAQVVRPFVADSYDAMRLSAQIASLLASLVLIVPMYFLGKLVFDRQTAFVGTLLFQVLPVTAQVASDGLSDNLLLCLLAFAMWFAALGFRRQRVAWFAAAGMMSGLAYLARPEGLMLLPASGVVMLWSKLRGETGWKALFTQGLCLAAGALMVTAPYALTIDRWTQKPTAIQLLESIKGEKSGPAWMGGAAKPPAAVNVPLAEWFNDFGTGKLPDTIWASKALAKETLKASFYVLPVFALIGGWVTWPWLRRDSAGLLIVTIGLGHSLLLWRLAKGAGYVAERHTLLVVFCSSYFWAAAIPWVGDKVARLPKLNRFSPQFWSALVAVALVLTILPMSLKSLHQNRAGHRAAGRWVAAHRGDERSMMIDPFSWAEYYAGYPSAMAGPDMSAKTVYTITEAGTNLHPRLHIMHFANYFAERGELVYHWPENVSADKAKVLVHRWHGDNVEPSWHQATYFYEMKKTAAKGQ